MNYPPKSERLKNTLDFVIRIAKTINKNITNCASSL